MMYITDIVAFKNSINDNQLLVLTLNFMLESSELMPQ